MRRFLFGVTSVIALSILVFPINAAVKAGAKCAKAGITSLQAGKKFTCIKSGKNLIWNKGTLLSTPTPKVSPTPSVTPTQSPTPIPTPTSTPTVAVPFEFKTFCDKDPLVPEAWKEFQNNLGPNQCAPPYRYVVSELGNAKPVTVQTEVSKLLPVSSCKLKRSEGFQNMYDSNRLLNPNISVLVIPFSSIDYPSNSDPKLDWGPYFDWIKSSLESMTDVNSNYRFEIAKKYFPINRMLTEFDLSGVVEHGAASATDRRWNLINSIVEVADPELNFSNYDYLFFVSPRSVPRGVLSNQIAYGRPLKTNDKTFYVNSYVTSYIDDFKSPYWITRDPFGFIHEMMHLFGTAEDYYGDADYGGTEVGAGNWGNMSRAMTDHLVWDKWTAKMVSDAQIRCASPTETSIHWIKPSTIRGEYEKLLLIRLNEYEAIGVESFRNSGFNYKIPKAQLGSIVYLINTKDIDDNTVHGDGLKVYCPTNRPCTAQQDQMYGNFKLALAALKPGDYVELRGVKISVVEAGDFGDVIKVEKL